MKQIFCIILLLGSSVLALDSRPKLNNYCQSKAKLVSADKSWLSLFYDEPRYNVTFEDIETKELLQAYTKHHPILTEPKYIYISYASSVTDRLISGGLFSSEGDVIRVLEDSECEDLRKDIFNIRNIKTGDLVSKLKNLGYKRSSVSGKMWRYEGSNQLQVNIEVSGVRCDSEEICLDENVQTVSRILDYKNFRRISSKE